jgi:hypothetical protein
MAFVDVTTGSLFATQLTHNKGNIVSELSRYSPKEIICNREFTEDASIVSFISERLGCSVEAQAEIMFVAEEAKHMLYMQFGNKANDLPQEGFDYAVIAVGASLSYLGKTQMCELPHIKGVEFYTAEQYMDIDFSSKRNLEITETATSHSTAMLYQNLSALTSAGIKFSLDDFGTGYSNMKRIASMPLHIVKLDKSFVNIEESPKLRIVVENTIRMIKDMDMKIVVEGIETAELAKVFSNLECEYIQGYYYSRPLPRLEFVNFIRQAG